MPAEGEKAVLKSEQGQQQAGNGQIGKGMEGRKKLWKCKERVMSAVDIDELEQNGGPISAQKRS